MALSYNLGYQESILAHPTRRQIFAGKTDSTFWNWEWVTYLQGWQIYIGVLILPLKGSTRCEFSCLTGHLYMDVQLLGQTQRSIVEWIVHKTRILNNYLTKERKVKGRPPINQIGHKIRNFPRTWRIQLVLHTSSVQGWKSANKIFFETDLRRGKGVYLSEKGFLFSLYSTWNQTEKATSG